MKNSFWHIVLLFISVPIMAQDSILLLPTPVITDSFHHRTNSYYHEIINAPDCMSLYTSGLLSDMLMFTTSGITRSSGPGKVTTYTKHGLPAEHTKTTWNQVELNSPLNGIVDFSTLPNFLLSDHSSLGNQTAPTIDLQSAHNHDYSTQFMFQTGSFGHFDVGIKKNLLFDKIKLFVGGEYVKSKNNFYYRDDLKRKIKQSNGEYEQSHIVLGYEHKLNKFSTLRGHGMYSQIKTNIPPAIFQQRSNAHQENRPFKLNIVYASIKGRNEFQVGYNNLTETLNYANPMISLNAKHQFARHGISTNWKRYLGSNSIFHLNLKETIERGKSDNFSSIQKTNITEANIHFSKSWNEKFILSSTLGIMHGRSIWSPVIYKLIGTYIPESQNRFRISVRSLYRLPTYNELFWEPGGNASLEPESGVAGILDYFHSSRKFTFELGTSIHRLENRILWTPQSSGYFSPVNIGKIGSEELYGGISINNSWTNFKAKAGIRYTYLHSRIISSSMATADRNDLPFTPRHSFTQHIKMSFKDRISIQLLGKYQSRSFTTTDNSNYLNAFYLVQSDMHYSFQLKRHEAYIFLIINNVTNATYFLTNGYPQPTRNWKAGFKIKLN